MSLVNKLFAPRIDHRGMSTPSEALASFCHHNVGTGIWSWLQQMETSCMVSLTLLIATPILSIGWYLLSLSKNRRGELLTPKVQNALEAKADGRITQGSHSPNFLEA